MLWEMGMNEGSNGVGIGKAKDVDHTGNPSTPQEDFVTTNCRRLYFRPTQKLSSAPR
jgi:hypothetical protein